MHLTPKQRELRAYMLGRAHGMESARSTLGRHDGVSPADLQRDVSRWIADMVELANDPVRARMEGWEAP